MKSSPQKPLLGLCPIGKFVFSQEDAVHYKKLIQHKLQQWEVPFVDLDGVLEEGMVKDQKHVGAAVAYFREQGIDALFMPHCNFGTEGAVGMIGHQLQVPTLLWGPRDEMPMADGTRLRDTLCGLFASSKVLHKLKVPFTYIENCRIDDSAFEQGMDTFLRAASVAKLFRKGFRIGHIGQRIDFFWTTIINESELLERFNIEVLPIGLVPFIESVRKRAARDKTKYRERIAELRRCHQMVNMADEQIINTLACADEMLEQAKACELDALAVEEFMPLMDALGTYVMYAESLITDKIAIGFESDIHGAISDLMVRRASFNCEPSWLADLTIRHPKEDNTILLWHGGAPLGMKDTGCDVEIGPHWILPSDLSGMPHFKLQDGPLTVARFDGDNGCYQLALGQGASAAGPDTRNNYVWMKVDNWPSWERKLMHGPFIHHIAMAYGNYAAALHEATKYIPHLSALKLGGYEQADQC